MAKRTTAKQREEDLQKQIQALKKANSKLKRRVVRLEAKLEAKDLGSSDAGDEDGDVNMRKMLEIFRELMEETTLGEDEECSICMDSMKINDSMSSCLQELAEKSGTPKVMNWEGEEGDPMPYWANEFPCPECRAASVLSQAITIKRTETERWNSLLDLSVSWAKIQQERAGEDDISGEEGGDEEGSRAESSDEENLPKPPRKRKNHRAPVVGESEEEEEAVSTGSDGEESEEGEYSEQPSSSPEKKQKLEALAKRRANSRKMKL
ncbi:hypothetical protein T439DRAFT_357107 [Meredithblackwellia eburnea MCA 4105]